MFLYFMVYMILRKHYVLLFDDIRRKSNMKKRILLLKISLMLSICFILFGFADIFAYASEDIDVLKRENELSEEQKTYIYDLVERQDLNIGKNISIYNADEKVVFDVYPLFNEYNQCIMTAEVLEDNISVSDDLEWYNNAKDIMKEGNEYIIYIELGKVYLENEYDKILLEDLTMKFNDKNKVFCSKTYESKVSEIKDFSEQLEFDDITDTMYGSKDIVCEKTNEDELSGDDCAKCDIKNFVRQGKYNLCWAASVATIVNYKKNKNITAKDVANKMKVGYNDCAGLETTNDALKSYGVNYKIINDKLSTSQIKKKINENNRPFIMALAAGKDGHMITCYSYKVSSGKMKIGCWDSNGVKRTFKYSDKVVIDGYTYKWHATIS